MKIQPKEGKYQKKKRGKAALWLREASKLRTFLIRTSWRSRILWLFLAHEMQAQGQGMDRNILGVWLIREARREIFPPSFAKSKKGVEPSGRAATIKRAPKEQQPSTPSLKCYTSRPGKTALIPGFPAFSSAGPLNARLQIHPTHPVLFLFPHRLRRGSLVNSNTARMFSVQRSPLGNPSGFTVRPVLAA